MTQIVRGFPAVLSLVPLLTLITVQLCGRVLLLKGGPFRLFGWFSLLVAGWRCVLLGFAQVGGASWGEPSSLDFDGSQGETRFLRE